jgi:hypothetical protein
MEAMRETVEVDSRKLQNRVRLFTPALYSASAAIPFPSLGLVASEIRSFRETSTFRRPMLLSAVMVVLR